LRAPGNTERSNSIPGNTEGMINMVFTQKISLLAPGNTERSKSIPGNTDGTSVII
jgi:hypothetical protein